MTPRSTALMCSPGIVVLLGSLAWFLADRANLVDRGVRSLDHLRDLARI